MLLLGHGQVFCPGHALARSGVARPGSNRAPAGDDTKRTRPGPLRYTATPTDRHPGLAGPARRRPGRIAEVTRSDTPPPAPQPRRRPRSGAGRTARRGRPRAGCGHRRAGHGHRGPDRRGRRVDGRGRPHRRRLPAAHPDPAATWRPTSAALPGVDRVSVTHRGDGGRPEAGGHGPGPAAGPGPGAGHRHPRHAPGSSPSPRARAGWARAR